MKIQPLMIILLAISLLAFAGVNPISAQVLYVLESPNPSTDGWFGYAVSEAGDVNSDGDADVIVGAWRQDRAYVFGGGGAILLHALSGQAPLDYDFGLAASGAGDLDGDGHDDLVVGAHHWNGDMTDPAIGGIVEAFSGDSGQLLRFWPGPLIENWWDGFGRSVDGTGDLNDDGYGDIIVGQSGQGRAHVFSGAGGGALDTLVSPNPDGGGFGISVSGLSDIGNDGCNDLLVGAHGEDGGAPAAGRAYVFSGSDGSLVHTLVSANPESAGYFGYSVSSVADVNGDEREDVVVGAYMENDGAIDAGRAYIFSGFGGQLLYTLVSPYPESAGYFGYSVSGAGDVNADGYGDVVVGAYREDGGAPNAGRAYIFSGNGGSLLYILESSYPESAGYFGYCVSGGGDMNGDGCSEVIVGAYQEDGGAVDAGRVYVFDSIEVPVELSAFTARALNGYVLLQWTTQTEQDNYGFHVYRAISEPVDYEPITADIIPGAGTSTVPHRYCYTDRTVEAGLTYFYRLADVDVQGVQTFHGPVSVTVAPARVALLGNHPNPFSVTTTIRLSLPAPDHVRVKIYSAGGDLVGTLADGEMTAGSHDIQWDGRDDAGRPVPPGTYTCRLTAHGQTQSRRVVLIR